MREMTLGDLFREKVEYAIDDFNEYHSFREHKFPTKFRCVEVDMGELHVSCDARQKHDVTLVTISYSKTVAEWLAADLDFTDANDVLLYGWRAYWLVHHEIGHWVWGHLHYYQEQGWGIQLGISETRLAGEGTNPPDAKDPKRVAHAAELLADAFATNALYEFIKEQSQDDENERHTSPTAVLIAVMSTVTMFYWSKKSEEQSEYHPDWRTRSLSMSRDIFEHYLREIYGTDVITPGKRLSAASINDAAVDFGEKVFGPAFVAAGNFAEEVGLPDDLFPPEGGDLFNAGQMMKIMTQNSDNDPIVANLLNLYREANILVDYSETHSPVHGFAAHKTYGESTMPENNNTEYRVLTEFDQAKTTEILEAWAKEHNVKILDTHFAKGPGVDEFKTFVDLTLQYLDSLGPDGLKSAVEYLQTALKHFVGRSKSEEE